MNEYVEKGKLSLPLAFFFLFFGLFFLPEDGGDIFFPYDGLSPNNGVMSHKTHHSN